MKQFGFVFLYGLTIVSAFCAHLYQYASLVIGSRVLHVLFVITQLPLILMVAVLVARFSVRKLVSSLLLLALFFLTRYSIDYFPFLGSELCLWIFSYTYGQLIITCTIAFCIFLPSTVETMPLVRAVKAILPDVLLVWSLMLLAPASLGLLITYSFIRIWSITYGVVPFKRSIKGIFAFAEGLGGLMLAGAITLGIYLMNPYMPGGVLPFALLMFALLVRLTLYTRLILHPWLKPLVTIVLILPTVVGVVFLLQWLSGLGADTGGSTQTASGGSDGWVGGADPSSGVGIDINGDGIIDGFDINGDGIIDTNILGAQLAPLHPVSSYVKSDGTFVRSHLRTLGDSNLVNNLRPRI